MESKTLITFEEKLQYHFHDISLLIMALTHKSRAYEQGKMEKDCYNERIEFLGDAILEHIISEKLYQQKPLLSEGDMTKKRAAIVCESSLCTAMKRIHGQEYLYLGKCEKISHGEIKDAILADAFESIIGAVYIDSNYETTKELVLRLLQEEIETILRGGSLQIDYKTKLQEKLQKHGNVKIEYELLKEEGPEHAKSFTVELQFNDKKIGEGIGKSKKHAEQQAAKNALESFEHGLL